MPLFGELGQTSQDSSVSDQIPDFCWDVWPNSPKSGKSILARSKTHELVFWIFIFVAGAFFFRDWRACGLACAPRPPKVDRADRGTPRHFNIIAYGWILGDEWRFHENKVTDPEAVPGICHFKKIDKTRGTVPVTKTRVQIHPLLEKQGYRSTWKNRKKGVQFLDLYPCF